MTPDLLVVGHIVKDIVDGGWRPGGSVLYSTAQAARLGLRVGAVTVCGPDMHPEAFVPDAEWQVGADDTTTSFENRYVDGRRVQRVTAVASRIGLDDIPTESPITTHDDNPSLPPFVYAPSSRRGEDNWRHTPIILLAPVIGEVDPALPALLNWPGSLIGLGAQGWLRRLDGETVRPGYIDPAPEWLSGHVVFVSEEDVADYPEGVAVWQERVPCVVLTRSRGGCSVWDGRGRHDIPAFDVEETDPTGAGDVFATAFLVRLKETGDTLEAARFASAAAAFAISGVGLEAIATRRQIDAFLRARSRVGA